MEFEKIMQKLTKYNQTHLLQFVDELSEKEKQELYHQIDQIDFSLLDRLSDKEETLKKGVISPIKAVTVPDIRNRADAYYSVGVQALKEGKVAAVLLAGGQGTRLGSDKPKGMLNIGETKDLYVFQILIQNLMNVVDKAGKWIPLLIMTSDKTHDDTVAFLKEHKYFGYPEESITFFMQDMAPSVDHEGKIFLEEKGKLALSPNGNGGWFTSLVHAGLLEKMKGRGVEWFNVFAVDNVMQRIADPYFIGAVIKENYVSGAKVVAKADPDEKVGVLCLEDGRPSIVEYYEMTEEIRTGRDEKGSLLYNYGVILNYLLSMKELEKIADQKLPIHVVERKVPYIDRNGNLIKPDKPNGYKFESLILDMIHMLSDCLPYEVVREKEFAPIKNKEGVDSLVTAKELLKKNKIEL